MRRGARMGERDREGRSGWLGVFLVAATFFYFLIFAQFGFLARLEDLNLGAHELKTILAAMGLGGMAGSFLVPLALPRWSLFGMLRLAFVGTGSLAFLTLLDLGGAGFVMAAGAVGVALGAQTVALVTGLRNLLGSRGWGWKIGLGTGVAYAACNVPIIFNASPVWQTVGAALVSWAGAAGLGLPRERYWGTEPTGTATGAAFSNYRHIVLVFAALVWLDSAAFYIIQHDSTLQTGTWGGTARLWRNGVVHAGAACLAGWWLMRGRAWDVLIGAFIVLGLAAMLVNEASTIGWGGLLYPAGVSLYSTALVACPAYLEGSTNRRTRAWRAAWLYALAGWMGSGMGIGMAENLHRVPAPFVAGAALLFAAPFLARLGMRLRTELGAALLLLGLAVLAVHKPVGAAPNARSSDDPVSRGREVYLSEGCIHCHSQYVRPDTRDEVMWGPARELREYLDQSPPLFGNRRQGPDLTNIGNRRSRSWLRQHFMNPRSVSPGSVMPSYAHLFGDERGEWLLDYMMALGQGTARARFDASNRWTPDAAAMAAAVDPERDGAMYRQHCAVCHGGHGEGGQSFAGIFVRPPTPLAAGPWIYAPAGMPADARLLRLARIIKFGLPGTDMPGHEWLADSEVVLLARFVAEWSAARKP